MTARDHNRTESESRGVGRDILISKKLGHAETVSGKLVDFRKTRYHDSALQSEAESTNEKNNGGLNGGTVWRDFASCESSVSQLVYRKLFPHGPHSCKNNIAKT